MFSGKQHFDDLTIRDVLADAGFHPHKSRMPCSIHGGSNPTSFTFTDREYFCFACGAGGGVFQLYQALHGCDRQEAMQRLSRLSAFSSDDLSFRSKSVVRETPHRRRQLAHLENSKQYQDLNGEYEWLIKKRKDLEMDLRNIENNVLAGRMPLADYYAKEQYCQYQLEGLDGQIPFAKYEMNQMKKQFNDKENPRSHRQS